MKYLQPALVVHSVVSESIFVYLSKTMKARKQARKSCYVAGWTHKHRYPIDYVAFKCTVCVCGCSAYSPSFVLLSKWISAKYCMFPSFFSFCSMVASFRIGCVLSQTESSRTKKDHENKVIETKILLWKLVSQMIYSSLST